MSEVATIIRHSAPEILESRPAAAAVPVPAQARPAPVAVAPTPMQMLQLAMEKGDISIIGKILDFQERWERAEARKAYLAAFAAFKAEAPEVLKNKHVSFGSGNKETEYDHASLDHACDVVIPVLSKHQLSHNWTFVQTESKVTVTCVLTHILGHSEKAELSSGADTSGGKNSIQGMASAVTYLERYTLLAVCGLAAKGKDDDGRFAGLLGDHLISSEQIARLEALIADVGADRPRFLKFMKVDSIDLIQADNYEAAIYALEQKKNETKSANQNPAPATTKKPAGNGKSLLS
jgi:hypothetical protein